MKDNKHHIRSQVIDITYSGDQQSASYLYGQMRTLYYDVLTDAIASCFDQFDEQDHVVFIDQLELDLGKISVNDLETDFPEKVITLLKEELRTLLNFQSHKYQRKTLTENHLQTVTDFLENGYLSHSNGDHLDRSFEACISSGNIDQLVKVLRKSHTVRNRFLRRFSIGQFRNFVRAIEPGNEEFILMLYESIHENHKRRNLTQKTDQMHSQMLWEIIIGFLVRAGDSTFNTIEFTVSIIRSVAARYNILFRDLVAFLLSGVAAERIDRSGLMLHVLERIVEKYRLGVVGTSEQSITLKYKKIDDLLKLVTDSGKTEIAKIPAEEVLVNMMRKDSSGFLKGVLRLSDKQSFFQGLVKYYGSGVVVEVVKLIAPLSAETIVDYHTNFLKMQSTDRLVKGGRREFGISIWKVILAIMLSDKGSRFNDKAFMTRMIHQTASMYNMSYSNLLGRVKAASDQLSRRISDVRHFVSLVNEVYSEEFGIEDSQENKQVAESDKRVEVEHGVKLHSILNNSNLYASISTWKLRDYVHVYFETDCSSKKIEDLIAIVRKLDNRMKFFEAIEANHFDRLLSRIHRSEEFLALHKKYTSAITKIFSPAHRGYLLLLDTYFFGLLLDSTSRNFSPAGFNRELLNYLNIELPISDTKFFEALRFEKIDLPDTVYQIHDGLPRTKSGNSLENHDFRNAVIQLLKFKSKNFSEVGCHNIMQLVNFLTESEKVIAINTFGQLNLGEMRKLVRAVEPSSQNKLVQLFQEESEMNFVLFLDQAKVSLDSTKHPKVQKILTGFREEMILSSYRINRFNINRLVGKLYAIIKNYNAEALFQIPTFSFPTNGNIRGKIAVIESSISRDATTYLSKESEEKEVIRKLLSSEQNTTPETVGEPLFIHNAGLVLLHPYLSHLFERAGFFESGEFKDKLARKQAVLYLNFILLNKEEHAEENLTLNKILCGLKVTDPIDIEFEVSEELQGIASGLLDAFISHWPSIENSSHDGLRGGWFWREGKLAIGEENYELTVEQKAYDLLMDKLPFTLSPIKCSWMKKSIKVNWR
ncbi:MAG: contractile injection system tape measure protein [Cyclobacteriaceae bacterium]